MEEENGKEGEVDDGEDDDEDDGEEVEVESVVNKAIPEESKAVENKENMTPVIPKAS